DLTASNFDFREIDPSVDSASAEYHRLEYRQVTAQVGGPIAKDRVWFFGGIQTYRDAFSMPGVDPVFAEQAPYKSDKYDVKINALIGEKHELYGFGHYDKWDSPNAPDPFIEPSALPGEGGTNPAWGVNWTNTASDKLLLEAGYSGWWSDDVYDSVVGAPPQDPFIDYTPEGGGPTTYSGGVWYPWDYETWRSTFKGKATYYADQFLKSDHEFKFGVQYSRGSALTNRGIGANGFYTYSYYGTLYRVYQDPFVYGAENKELGIFIDDTITVNDRLTVNVGVRFDHNTADVPDYPQLTSGTPSISPAGNFKETGETIPGVEVSKWNLVSPRFGFTYQPTADGRSKIQGSFGVYYDHNVSGNWDFPPPQMPDINAFIFNEETGRFDIPYYTTPGDLIPVAQNIDPPRALNYSIGYEQQFGETVAAGIQYVYKDTEDMIGWNVTGGVYEPFLFVDPFTGTEYTLFKIVERPTITKGNDPGDLCERLPQASACADRMDYWQTYHGVLLTFEKRFSNNWALNASYTWSKSEGLSARPLTQTQNNPAYGSTDSSDLVNHFLNATGRLQGDRPHMFRLQSVFQELPLGLNASVLADFSSGRSHVRQIRTPSIGGEGQGRTVIILERDFRLNPIESIDVTVGKRFNFGQDMYVRVDGTIYNILNSDNELNLASLRLQTPDETFTPDYWTQPRRLEIRLGFGF
ncbi:MAG TPA: TonB-dependent receptor, partial [Acidobacteriota bacterium]|nr:TonB-dependent receptor [Acidobacteriota bacterium]